MSIYFFVLLFTVYFIIEKQRLPPPFIAFPALPPPQNLVLLDLKLSPGTIHTLSSRSSQLGF